MDIYIDPRQITYSSSIAYGHFFTYKMYNGSEPVFACSYYKDGSIISCAWYTSTSTSYQLPYKYVALGTLHYFAVTRKDGIWRTFLDGELLGAGVNASTAIFTTTEYYLRVGLDPRIPSRYGFYGGLDDMIVIEGQALWTDSFYVPTGYILDEGIYEKTLDKSDEAKLYKPIQKNY